MDEPDMGRRNRSDVVEHPAPPLRVPKTFAKQLAEFGEEWLAALASPAMKRPLERLEIMTRLWQLGDEDPTQVGQSAGDVIEALRVSHPDLLAQMGETQAVLLLGACLGLVPAGVPLRPQGLPGQPGPNPRVVVSAADATQLRERIAPGQIWVDATCLSGTEYGDLWGAVSYQQQALTGRGKDWGGRPAGQVDEARAPLIAWIRKHPAWLTGPVTAADRETIHDTGVAAGYWPDGPVGADARRQRVARLLKHARAGRATSAEDPRPD